MSPARAILTGCFCVALPMVAARAYVGATDTCSTPTPYPPPGAGAGVVFNTDMESGFASGVANQWTGWQDSRFTTQVFYAGTDRCFDGTASQKLNLPQPASGSFDQDAGIYQRFWVVPGGTYTASARIYLHFPNETYGGEDLVAYFGLNPFGEDSLSGSGTIWSDLNGIGTKDTWVIASISATAQNSVMTLAIKARRKFDQHGDGALAWFDHVTLSGPVPTGTPPGPEPDPVDPESLIPATMGGNLVANASFEGTYDGNGVSSGWNRWWTTGTGTWRRSQRVGKVGAGQYSCGGADNLAAMKPKTVLLIGPDPMGSGNGTFGDAQYLASTYPELENTIFVARPFIDDYQTTWKSDPVYWGTWLADWAHGKQQTWPRIDAWQCNNEPDWGGTWQQVVQMEKAFADRLHYWGMKSCSLNLSTGSPGDIWRMVDPGFDPSCHDLMDVADYLGQHCYGGPDTDVMLYAQVGNSACDFALRPRRFKDMYDRREWRLPPVIATEGSTWGPWHGSWPPSAISADLILMGTYMNANPWWCGYTNFVVGSQCIGGWAGWDIVGQGTIIADVANWNMNNPADAKDGVYSQMFGAGKVHPQTTGEMTPAGNFNGGVSQVINGLNAGQLYLFRCWMKYEFRGAQPSSLKFYLGVDSTGQTGNPNASTIDWGGDQVSGKAPVHETFSHVWRTFLPTAGTVSIWLRASQAVADPSFMVYVDQVEVRQVDQSQNMPVIGLPAGPIQARTDLTADAPTDSFDLCNVGVGTLSYSITVSAPLAGGGQWLSVYPTAGSRGTGQCDTILLIYNTSTLPLGSYTGTVTVSAPGAANPNESLTVQLEVTTAKPDFDRDGDVDQEDFGRFQRCLSGPGITQSDSACVNAHLDTTDDDVDQNDMAIFLNCVSGPGEPASLNCTP